MAKVRIVPATPGYYEVEVKRAWYLPWATMYDGQLKECASETIRVIKIEYLHQLMNFLFSMKKRELDVEL